MAQFNAKFYFLNFRSYEKSTKSVQGNQIVKTKNGELGYMLTLGQYNDRSCDFETKTVFPEFGNFDYPDDLKMRFMDEIECVCSIETSNSPVYVNAIKGVVANSPYAEKELVDFRLFENIEEARENGFIK